MVSKGDLEAAAAAGIISSDQLSALTTFVDERSRAPLSPIQPEPQGEETLRFIRNFHDVFLAMGVALLAIGLGVGVSMAISKMPTKTMSDLPVYGWYTSAMFAGCAAFMWALAEFFSKRRRLFLPSIALCIAFTAFLALALLALYGAIVAANAQTVIDDVSARMGEATPRELQMRSVGLTAQYALPAMIGLILAPALFYWRFRLPFALGLLGLALAGLAAVVVAFVSPAAFTAALSPLMLALGLALFAAGVAFDARDPARQTRMSDNGFWLHMAAAPLILNGALGWLAQVIAPSSPGGLFGAAAGSAGTMLAAATLAVVFFLGFVSLLINRRALIVSALLTTGVAVGVLMNATGLGAMGIATATLVTLGAGVLILGAGWHSIRRALLGTMPRGPLLGRIFPPEVAE